MEVAAVVLGPGLMLWLRAAVAAAAWGTAAARVPSAVAAAALLHPLSPVVVVAAMAEATHQSSRPQ